MAGWAISIGCGAIAGLAIGFIYRLLNDSFEEMNHFFSDATLYEYPKVGEQQPAENPNGPERANAAPHAESQKQL